MKQTKKEIYAAYGIVYDTKQEKIFHPVLGFIPVLLINGNDKIGKNVYHFSTLPGTTEYRVTLNNKEYILYGTCGCDCENCYAKTGRYAMQDNINSLGVKTWLINNDLDFVYRAISAQLKADHIEQCRIHVAGDFNSKAYADMWLTIVQENKETKFWTYTKTEYENQFDSVNNGNIVKSLIPGIGYNFGTCGYIINVYNLLKKQGKKVYICKCGMDDNQHCNTCKGCSDYEYVLFIKHSDRKYNAKKDPLFPVLCEIINNQEDN